MAKEVTHILCPTPGLAGTTEVIAVQHPDGEWEARIGIALFGSTNMDQAGFERAEFNPFHEEFHDNYACGRGKTKEEALEALSKDFKAMHESLWV